MPCACSPSPPRAIRENDRSPALDAVDDNRGDQVIKGLGEFPVGGVHLPGLARERDGSTAVRPTDTMRGSCVRPSMLVQSLARAATHG